MNRYDEAKKIYAGLPKFRFYKNFWQKLHINF